MSEFRKTLRYGRKDRKLTQREMARMSGLTPQAIAKLESGIYVPLDRDALIRIASAIGMDTDIFTALYHSEFQQELRKSRSSDLKQAKSDKTEPGLSPELLHILKTVMMMPAGTKDNLIRTIQMLVKSFESIEAA